MAAYCVRIIRTYECSVWTNYRSLGAFEKLWKVTNSFVMSVLPTFSPFVLLQQLVSHRTNFYWTWYLNCLELWRENSRKTGTLHEDVFTFMSITRSIFLRGRNCSDKICRANLNTYRVFSNFLRKLCLLCDNVEEYYTAGHTRDTVYALRKYVL
jgi:hypothetical protein